MLCPYCQTPQQPAAPECPACRLTFPRTCTLVGAAPRLVQVVADTTRTLSQAEVQRLKKHISRIHQRFPQLVLQIVVHEFPHEHPFSMHVFWLFNAANFAGDSRRGKENHALLLALDPVRGEAAIMPGYGLEPFLHREALDHLLELASPAWQDRQWASGLAQVLDGFDKFLESIAIPDESVTQKGGDF